MAPTLSAITAQAAALNIVSVISAQLITKASGAGILAGGSALNPLGLELLPIAQFLTLTLLITPPNVLWQRFLEARFPGYPATPEKQKLKVDDDGKGVVVEKKLDLKNTAIKWMLDQTAGSWVNTTAFIIGITALRGGSLADCLDQVALTFWPLQMAAYKLWPIWSIISFLVIPPARRVVAGAAVGMFWNIYMVLKVS